MARVFRPGGHTSADRALTPVVRADTPFGSNTDVSPNRMPGIGASDDGRFALSWRNDFHGVLASIDLNAGLIEAPTQVADISEFQRFHFAGDSSNGTFMLARGISGFDCKQRVRLAVEGSLAPAADFDVGLCANGEQDMAFAFLPGERLLVQRSYPEQVTHSIVVLPAMLEVNNVTVSEGNPGPGALPQAALSVTLSKQQPNEENVQVSYVARNATATGGQDFAFTRDTATFAYAGGSGETARTIVIPLLPDTQYEDDEHFTVELELPQNALIRRGEERATVVIKDDDDTPPITPDCEDGPQQCREVQEGLVGESTLVTIDLHMAQPVGRNVQINYATLDGTALAGSDYQARSGTVQIVAGATHASIDLTVLGDDNPENLETFRLRLSAADRVHLSDTDLVIHIVDDAECFVDINTIPPPPDPETPTALVAPKAGITHTVALDTRNGCAWNASTVEDWIHVQPSSGSAPTNVTITVDPYHPPPQEFERSGSLRFALDDASDHDDVTVDQDGNCDFDIDSDAQHFAVAGGTQSFHVDASVPECAWLVESPAPWITILSPQVPVFGDGTVTYQVDANASEPNVEAGERSVRLDSDQFDYDVSEDGCIYDLDTHDIAATAEGNSEEGETPYTVDITTDPVCSWTATSATPWILIADGHSGSGEGTVSITVLDNPTVQVRAGMVNIGDEVLTVTQAGIECSYGLGPATLAACPDGRTFALDVSGSDGCSWTLHAEAPWIGITDNDSGTGEDRATGLIDVNLSQAPRSSSVQLRAQNIGVASATVLQEGYLTFEQFDGVRPAGWSYQPDAAWSASGGMLTGIAAGQGSALALDQASVCRECDINARIAVLTASSVASEPMTLLGWYTDANNHAGLAMDEFSNRWTFFQRVNGTRFAVSAEAGEIVPGTFYDVRMVFDGAAFAAEVGGQPLLQIPLQAGAAPFGSAGLQLAASNGRLAELRVNHVEAGMAAPADPDHIFRAGFEFIEAGPNLSQCRLLD